MSNLSEPGFSGIEVLYRRFRDPYPPEAISFLEDLGGAELVDLACGTGEISFFLGRSFESVACCDVAPGMLGQFEERFTVPAYRSKFRLQVDMAESFVSQINSSSIDLITIGRAFHWLDQSHILRESDRVLRPNGKVAVVSMPELSSAPPGDWRDIANQTAGEFLGYGSRFSGHGRNRSMRVSHERVIASSPLRILSKVEFKTEGVRSIESMIANILTTSYANPSLFGGKLGIFTSLLENRLVAEFGKDGITETMKCEVILVGR